MSKVHSHGLPPLSVLPNGEIRRRGQFRRSALPLLAAFVGLAIAAGTGQAREGVVETPAGEFVTVRHKIHPGGVIEDFYEYIDGDGRRVKHGPFKRTYRNGVMRELTTYRHGVRHGRFVARYENDEKQVEGTYKDGLLDGRVIHYYRNGQVQTDAAYRDGELHGAFAKFYSSGEPQEAGQFVSGQRDGLYVEYNEDGSPYLEATYRAGEMSGPVALHSETGELMARGTLEQERIQGEWACFDGGEAPAKVRTDCAGRAYWECRCR